MPGIAMKKGVVTELQRQVSAELENAHRYLALAVWCHDQNLKGFARYFSKQAAEERGHAQKFMEHLLDRGVMPRLTALPAPKVDYKDLAEVAETAQKLEQETTAEIYACYKAALKDEDPAAQILLQWFISEQVEEENWTDEMVARVDRASCAGAMEELDRHIEKHLDEEGVKAGGEAG